MTGKLRGDGSPDRLSKLEHRRFTVVLSEIRLNVGECIFEAAHEKVVAYEFRACPRRATSESGLVDADDPIGEFFQSWPRAPAVTLYCRHDSSLSGGRRLANRCLSACRQ